MSNRQMTDESVSQEREVQHRATWRLPAAPASLLHTRPGLDAAQDFPHRGPHLGHPLPTYPLNSL